jgi:putative alpha-1,2-mannosidase
MGSWYVFSAMGIFPNAGQDLYWVNGPKFRKATVALSRGRRLVIEGRNASDANIYVQSATLNGRRLNGPMIRYADIKDGGRLVFEMGPKPSAWGM